MGGFAQQVWQRDQTARDDQLKMQIAPLSEALRADQTRLALYANPDDPSKPLAGKEAEYNATHDRMAQTIGQMRRLYGQNPQGANPVEAGVGNLLDKLHITNHLKNHVAEVRADNAKKYADQTGAMTSAYAAGAIPYSQTPEGQAEAKKTADALTVQAQRSKDALAEIQARNEGSGWTTLGQPTKVGDQWVQVFKNKAGETKMEPLPEGFVPVVKDTGPKVGTLGEFLVAAYGEHPTAQQQIEGRQKWAQAIAGTTTGTHTVMVPQPDGSIKEVTVETTSTKHIGSSSSSATPSKHGTSDAGASNKDGKTVGGRLTGPQSKLQTEYAEAVRVASLVDKAVNVENSEQDQLLVNTLLHSTLGRVNEQEIQRIFSRGGWGMAPERWKARIKTGGLPRELKVQLQEFVHNQVQATKDAMDALPNSVALPSQPSGAKSLSERLNEALK